MVHRCNHHVTIIPTNTTCESDSSYLSFHRKLMTMRMSLNLEAMSTHWLTSSWLSRISCISFPSNCSRLLKVVFLEKLDIISMLLSSSSWGFRPLVRFGASEWVCCVTMMDSGCMRTGDEFEQVGHTRQFMLLFLVKEPERERRMLLLGASVIAEKPRPTRTIMSVKTIPWIWGYVCGTLLN